MIAEKIAMMEELKKEIEDTLVNKISKILESHKLILIAEKTGIKLTTLSNLKLKKLKPNIRTLVSYLDRIESVTRKV